MLVSLKEISKYVDISDLTPEEIASRLTFSGIEVEEIKKVADATNLVIGEVISCLPHPDSDHLHVCKVNVGDEILDIVCGAPNVRVGLKVIVAKPGAVLCGNKEIKRGEIRGQISNGMLCALNELGVDPKYLRPEQISGIEELDADAEVGNTEVLKFLGLDDVVLDLSLLANRSDCFSLYNVAREIAALFSRKVNIPEEKENGTFDADFIVGSETPKCEEFAIKVIEDIKVKESPKWLKEVLRSQGIKSINNIVDIDNYVMLLTGQPIHMYDLDKLPKHELIVKDDVEGEVIALDDNKYLLQKGDLVVTSKNVPVCIAGVMGLKNVEVTKDTKNVVIEIANFNHASVRKTVTRLGLMSDSSQRFIKGINPSQANFVENLAARLIKEILNSKKESKTLMYDTLNHDPKLVNCSVSYINNRLGTDFSKELIVDTLTKLHFKVNMVDEDKMLVEVPSYRIDVDGKADLSEEVIRYNGFDSVKNELPYMETTVGGLKPNEKKERVIENYLLNNGFDEILSYVLVNEKDDNLFNYFNKDNGYVIKNPLTEEHKFVRKNLLTSCLRNIEYNLNHDNEDFKVFEISPVQTKKVLESHLVLGFVGKIYEQDSLIGRDVNFFDAKGVLENILKMFNIMPSRVRIDKLEENEEFHPGRSAKVLLDGKLLAVLGELHPLIKKEFSLKNEHVVVMEINLSVLFNTKTAQVKFNEFSRFPSVRRDYAFVIKEDIKFQDLVKEIKKASSLIKDIKIFDIYKGINILPNHKSIAIAVFLSKLDATLKDEEINTVDKKIRDIISLKFNGEIRK